MDLMVFEYLAQQITEDSDDTTVYEYMNQFLDSDLTEEETKKVAKILTEVIEKLGKPSVSMVQMNLSLYSQWANANVKEFYIWLNARLQRVIDETWTIEEFKEFWDKYYLKIEQKMNNTETQTMDKIGIANVIMFVNDLF